MPVPAGSGATSSSTFSDLIAETKRHLLSYQREPMNKLSAGVSAAATTLTFTYPITNLKAGSYLEADLELMYVWTVNTGAQTCVVERAQLGSVAAIHDAGDMVVINPRFPDFAIARAINQELHALSSPGNGLYAVRYVDLTSSASAVGYDMTGVTSIIDVLEVREKSVNSSFKDWPRVAGFEFDRSVSTSDFPSGNALFLKNGSIGGRPLRVQYKAAFAPLVTLTDDVTAVSGLPLSAHDIPPIGAAARLAAPREIKRTFTESQGETRRAEEVQAGSTTSVVRNLLNLRATRIVEEATSLAQQYPPREAMSYGGHGRYL